MGGGRFTADDWGTYSSAHIRGKIADKIYTSHSLDSLLDPKGVTVRESCDSVDNPNSNAIIVTLDVTGSMSSVLESIAKNLGTLVTEIYNRKPVTDPHLMFAAVGDVEYDSVPLQITQFEADIRIAEQLTKVYFEKGGGGNSYESYTLAWYFAALHTKIDCFEKRAKKGFLFTIGDEEPTRFLSADNIEKVLDEKPQKSSYSPEELFEMASRTYNVYHLIIEEGSHCRSNRKEVVDAWTKLLGQRAIPVSDCQKVAEIIVSILQKEAGEDTDKILKSWDGATSLVVAKAINSLEKTINSDDDLIRMS